MTDDLRSLRPLATLDRRGFVTTALAGGFAAATLPVSAETLVTPSEGLDAGEVRKLDVIGRGRHIRHPSRRRRGSAS
jgi:hypothetical protein